MNNLNLYQTTIQLRTILSESQLPIGVLYYILKDLLTEIENLYHEVITKEYEEQNTKMDTVTTPLNVDQENIEDGQE